ncbi:hypothetical protein [Engelhardtia mirabilis]|uniref:Lipopolysaccharide-assembly n=1 Tax=Engelhardtia mirabilis TaxID=2528011 RepID=A0A518BNI1_9BACT|nr:hypothetical protein Pla133_36150 [Planctomycetes bacterium Pla133]QDV02842.1 hypothetical protein Pla86_36130 [Planctomycetes bacterium Pla86]
MRQPITLLLAAIASLALTACGWRAGLPTPDGARTLGVAFPGNDSWVRDIEVDLGLALSEAALERLSLEPAAADRADLVISGRVDEVRGRAGIRSQDNVLLETGTEILVSFELRDRRSGELLGRSDRSIEAGFLVPEATSPLRAPELPESRSRVIRNLAEGLILDLFAPPSYEDEASSGQSGPEPTSPSSD